MKTLLLLLSLVSLNVYAGNDGLFCKDVPTVLGTFESVNANGIFEFKDLEGNRVIGNTTNCTIIVDKCHVTD